MGMMPGAPPSPYHQGVGGNQAGLQPPFPYGGHVQGSGQLDDAEDEYANMDIPDAMRVVLKEGKKKRQFVCWNRLLVI